MLKAAMLLGCLLGLAVVSPAFADIDPPTPATAPSPKLLPICADTGSRECGLLARDGHWVVTPRYDIIEARADGWAVELNDRWGYLNPDGSVRFAPRFDNIGTFASNRASAGPEDAANDDGYIDATGSWVTPRHYFAAGGFADGLASVEVWKGSSNGGHAECWYITPDNKPAFPGRWDSCDAFQFGMATISGHGIETDPTYEKGSVAVIDTHGGMLIPWTTHYNNLTILSADRILASSDTGDALLDRHGHVLFKVPAAGVLQDAGAGRVYYSLGDDGKCGLLNVDTGKPLVTPAHGWDMGNSFSDGLAWVMTDPPDGLRRWSAIDRQGHVVVQPSAYAQVNAFSGGAAPVSLDGTHWELIDHAGHALTKPDYSAIEPAWNWGPQSPRVGDAWRATLASTPDTHVYLDARGKPLASVAKLPCGIEEVRNAQGVAIWPTDAAAHCALNKQDTADAGWDVAAGSRATQAQVMALRVAKAKKSLAAMGGLRSLFQRGHQGVPSTSDKLRMAPWQVGPTLIQLGQHATLDLPAGYRYLAPQYVPAVQRMLGAKPNSTHRLSLALVTNNDFSVAVWVAASPQGHFDTGQLRIDPKALKEDMESNLATGTELLPTAVRSGPHSFTTSSHSIDWLLKPRWFPESHRLDWAYSDFVIHETVNMESTTPDDNDTSVGNQYSVNSVHLGRIAAVSMFATFSGLEGKDRAVVAHDMIDHLMPQVHFEAGHRYADATPGDPRAALGLLGYITGGPGPYYPQPSASAAAADKPLSASGRRVRGVILMLVALLVMGGTGWAVYSITKKP